MLKNLSLTIVAFCFFYSFSISAQELEQQAWASSSDMTSRCMGDKDFKKKFEKLHLSLITPLDKALDNTKHTMDHPVHKHIIDSVSSDGSQIKLKDGLAIHINWWDRSYSKKWKKEEQLYITFDFTYQQLKVEHAVLNEMVWASSEVGLPRSMFLIRSIRKETKGEGTPKIILDNRWVFRPVENSNLSKWKSKSQVLIFANSQGNYQLWNLDLGNIVLCEYLGSNQANMHDVLGIENRLEKKILQQPEAVKAVTAALIKYSAGLKDKGRPIAVFLFLGPTGVGKTELAKVLAEEIYNDSSKILRFDMSHFTEYHTISRLIGSPPGYVNHEEGGQLTEPLTEDAQQIVLLDELEKAHPQVIKAFLPVFDEGFILDSKNNRIDCSEIIFIMTSNLCGPQIAELYNCGLTEEEILPMIEPVLMETLSPELYNRVEPVLFRPLAKETMCVLVDLMLKQVEARLIAEKNLRLLFDESLKNFLVEKGYHPLLGARNLKKLIERRIVSEVAYYIIQNNPPIESVLQFSYDEQNDSVIIHNL